MPEVERKTMPLSGEKNNAPSGEKDDASSGEEDVASGGEREDAPSGEKDDAASGEEDNADKSTTVQLASTEKQRKLHKEADKRYGDNAKKMQLKYCKGSPGNFVSVKVLRIDHAFMSVEAQSILGILIIVFVVCNPIFHTTCQF